jgi:hypothetical protein
MVLCQDRPINIYFFLYYIMGKTRNMRISMRGGDWLNPSTWDTSSLNPSSWSLFSSGTQADADAKAQADADAYAKAQAQSQAAPTGGRRRRRRKRMNGGDVMPNSPLSGFASDAMEVHDIKMAQPQTLVGGRRRKSSKRRGRTARKGKSRSRNSRRN